MSRYGKIAQEPVKEALKNYKYGEFERGKRSMQVSGREQSNARDLSGMHKKGIISSTSTYKK